MSVVWLSRISKDLRFLTRFWQDWIYIHNCALHLCSFLVPAGSPWQMQCNLLNRLGAPSLHHFVMNMDIVGLDLSFFFRSRICIVLHVTKTKC